VKKYHLTNGIVAALLLASPIAGAETKYPAANFQPEVIYQDSEYIGKQGGQAKAASKAKAAPAKASRADSRYPAANFEPEIVYQDAEQIEKVARAAATTRRAPSAGVSGAEAGKSGGIMENYWFGLVALALAGFAVLYSRRPKPEVSEAPAYAIDTSGLTGVARYLRMKAMSGPTGVQKYIEKHGKEFTGVEKYLRRRG